MTEYQNGDLIEAVKGETTIRGRVRSTNNAYFWLTVDGIAATIPHSEAFGWTVTVIEKAAPKDVLPTEPGFYSDRKGDAWKLADNGYWYDKGYVNGTSNRDGDYLAECAPFTRLEPVPVTAKKFSDRVFELWQKGHLTLPEQLLAVEAEFGVSS